MNDIRTRLRRAETSLRGFYEPASPERLRMDLEAVEAALEALDVREATGEPAPVWMDRDGIAAARDQIRRELGDEVP